jgi:hypothetical protein
MKNAFEYEAELAALREELLRLEEEYDTLEHANITLKLSLADAERLLTRARIYARGEFGDEIDKCLLKAKGMNK